MAEKIESLFVGLGLDARGLFEKLEEVEDVLGSDLGAQKLRREMGDAFDGVETAVSDMGETISGALDGVEFSAEEMQDAFRDLDGIEAPFGPAEDEAEELQDRLQGLGRSASGAERKVDGLSDELKELDAIGLFSDFAGVEEETIRPLTTLTSILPKIATAAGPAVTALAGVGAAVGTLSVGAAAAAGGLTALATAMAKDFGTKDLQQELQGVSAEIRTAKERFVSAFEPAIRGAAIPAMRLFGEVVRGVSDDLAAFTTGVGRFVQNLDVLPGVLGAIGTVARGISQVGDAAPVDLFADKLQGALTGMQSQIEAVRRQFEVGLIPRSEMLTQIASVREGAVKELLKIQSSFKGLLPDTLINAQLGKLDAVEQKLRDLSGGFSGGFTAGLEAVETLNVEVLNAATSVDTLNREIETGTARALDQARASAQAMRQQLEQAKELLASRSFKLLGGFTPAQALPKKVKMSVLGGASIQKAFKELPARIQRTTQAASLLATTIASGVRELVRFETLTQSLGKTFKQVGLSMVRILERVIQQIVTAAAKALVFKGIFSLFSVSSGGVGSLFKAFAGIPGLAKGGVVTSPTLAMIGEGGQSEAVIPLNKLSQMQAAPQERLVADISLDRLLLELQRNQDFQNA